MKKITFWIVMLITSLGFSQALPFDFDNTLHGFVGDGGTTVGNGTGSDVLEITGAVADWDNAQVTFASPIDLSDDANNTLRFTIQSTTAAMNEVHQHGVSFQGGGGAIEMNFQTVGTDVLNVELNFGANLGSREKMVIFTDVGDFGAQSGTGGQSGTPTPGLSGTYIIDNISLGADPGPTCSDGIQNGDETGVDCGGSCPNACTPTCSDGIMNGNETGVDCGGPDCDACPTPPTMAAPAPPSRPAADVVSIFSDAYAAIPGINYDAGFCGTMAATEIMVEGNATMAYNDKDCQGIDFSANTQDVTGLTNLHVDFFIQAGTDLVGKVFNIILVYPDGEGDLLVPIDINALSPAPVPGTWYSYDVAVSLSPTTIRQTTVVSNLKDLIWYDNLYLHKNTTLGLEDNVVDSFEAFPNPTRDTWTINSRNTPIESISVYNILGKQVLALKPNKEQVTIDASSLKSGIYFARINTLSGNGSVKLIKQ